MPFHRLANFNVDRLSKKWRAQSGAVVEGIFSLNYADDAITSNNEHEVEKPYYIQKLLALFVEFPSVTYNELHLEYHISKNFVAGSIDFAVGTPTNGTKPYVHIRNEGQCIAIYLASLCEAKSSSVALGKKHVELSLQVK